MSSYFPSPPANFKVTNIDNDPTPKVEVAWDEVTDNDLRQDFLNSNDQTQLSATASVNPARISAHERVLVGYLMHRSESGPGFIPDQSNRVADEVALPAGTLNFIDTAVIGTKTFFYKLGFLVDIS